MVLRLSRPRLLVNINSKRPNQETLALRFISAFVEPTLVEGGVYTLHLAPVPRSLPSLTLEPRRLNLRELNEIQADPTVLAIPWRTKVVQDCPPVGPLPDF